MIYESPVIQDLGSVAKRTFTNEVSGNSKQAVIYHLDWKCETSSGSGEDRCGTHPNQ
jgi:hypothetical protein